MSEVKYEQNPEATDYEDEKPRVKKPRRQRAFMKTRSPFGLDPIRVYDNEDADTKILQFCGEGRDLWLENNEPELASWIHALWALRLKEDTDKKIKKKPVRKQSRLS